MAVSSQEAMNGEKTDFRREHVEFEASGDILVNSINS